MAINMWAAPPPSCDTFSSIVRENKLECQVERRSNHVITERGYNFQENMVGLISVEEPSYFCLVVDAIVILESTEE